MFKSWVVRRFFFGSLEGVCVCVCVCVQGALNTHVLQVGESFSYIYAEP